MDLYEYQETSAQTAIYPQGNAIAYLTLGLCGEAGEVAEHIKKTMRDGRKLDSDALVGELGDVLWYLSQLANELGLGLDRIARANLAKLQSRKERGVLQGSGSDR